jgi:hypothetical protein
MSIVIAADVPSKRRNIVSSITLVVLLKKDATSMEEMKR